MVERALPPPSLELDAVNTGYQEQIADLFRHLVTNLTTGNEQDATVRFQRGFAITQKAYDIATQTIANA